MTTFPSDLDRIRGLIRTGRESLLDMNDVLLLCDVYERQNEEYEKLKLKLARCMEHHVNALANEKHGPERKEDWPTSPRLPAGRYVYSIKTHVRYDDPPPRKVHDCRRCDECGVFYCCDYGPSEPHKPGCINEGQDRHGPSFIPEAV
jgi:hypothetical protein